MDPFGTQGIMFGWIFWLIIIVAISLLIITVINKNQLRNNNKKFKESPFDILKKKICKWSNNKRRIRKYKKEINVIKQKFFYARFLEVIMFYKYGLIILSWILVIVIQNSNAQSKSELIRNGINKYLQSNYSEAMRYFNMALTNSSFTETKSSVIVTPHGISSSKEIKAATESGNDYYTGVSTKNYVGTSKIELSAAEEKKSDQIMKNNNIELSAIYLYKGRINLHLKNYSLALQNFTKGINLNPSYNKSNIGIAIISKLQNYTEVCKDLKIAVKEGDISANTIFKDICN